MKIFTVDKETAVEIEWVGRKGGNLIVWGKVLGTMEMEMHITPEEICKGFKIFLNWRILSYALLLPYYILKLGLRVLFVREKGGI